MDGDTSMNAERKPRPPTRKPKRLPQEEPSVTPADYLARHWAAIRSGLVGGLGVFVLLMLRLIQLPLLICLVVPGFVVVYVGVGMLAGVLAGDDIQTARQAMGVSAVAGFVTGVIGAIIAMFLAAFGLMLPRLGDGVLAQFSPAQLENMAAAGISPDFIRLAGSVFFALLLWGIVVTIISVILSVVGGRIYYRLR
jgi:hypothetical protein